MVEENARRLFAYAFLVVFANDDTIDDRELGMLERMALEDGRIDDAGREALSAISSRDSKEDPAESAWSEIESFNPVHRIK